MNRRCEVIFSGHVQGVGFRYTTRHIAQRFQVTGFVRNLSDGRVELIAEGEESQLKDFVAEIRSRMSEHIESTEQQLLEPTAEFDAFDIRF